MQRRSDRSPVAEWWRTVDRWFLFAFIALIGFGIVLSFAASPDVAERIGLDTFHFVERHAMFIVPAIAMMIGVSFLDDRQVRRVALVVLLGAMALMVLALFFGVEVKGSRRWVRIAGISVQPSEFAKPAFVIICAWLFAEHLRRPEIPGNLLAGVLFAAIAALLVAQPDLGQTVLVAGTWGAMFFMAGMSWLWIVVLGGIGVAGLVGAYLALPHVASRIDGFLSGAGDTFQVDTGREAIVRGGWFCLVLVSIFALIVLRGLMRSLREEDHFRRLAVSGLVTLIGLQSMINIMVNLQLLPAKGMTLPFVSYGGSSMIAVAISAGFILALTRKRPETRFGHVRFSAPASMQAAQ